jgi:HK97 family phage major capsid protein
MDIKSLYDRVLKADAERHRIAAEIVRLNDADKLDEALQMQAPLDKANAEYEGVNKLYLSALATTSNSGGDPAKRFTQAGGTQSQQPPEIENLRATPEYRDEWLRAFRAGVTPENVNEKGGSDRFPRLINALTETGGSPAGSEGGFLNPVDFDGKIIELQRLYVDLASYVNVEEVITLTGWRVIEQFAAALPLTKSTTEIEERTTEGESPLFSKIDYSLDEYRDFLPVSNNFMADTPVNIMNYLARWFSKKVVLTNNSLVLDLLNGITGTNVTDKTTTLDVIKTTLNKTLDPIFSANATIFTNQSGLEVMDQLKDGDGRPMLQPDPTNATAFRVKGRPVVFLSDAHWGNVSGKSRIAIGDGRSFMTIFRRAGYEFSSTNIGGKAWRSNSTEVRGIARLDSAAMDTGAMTVLKVTL